MASTRVKHSLGKICCFPGIARNIMASTRVKQTLERFVVPWYCKEYNGVY
jgi:hypothetical protein